MLTKEAIQNQFLSGYNCTQIIFLAYAEKLGLTEEKALELADELGNGTFRGGTCGALDGAIAVMKLLYEEDPSVSDKALEEKISALKKAFCEENGDDTCKGLLGVDLTNPQDLDLSLLEELLKERCPAFVLSALTFLEKEQN